MKNNGWFLLTFLLKEGLRMRYKKKRHFHFGWQRWRQRCGDFAGGCGTTSKVRLEFCLIYGKIKVLWKGRKSFCLIKVIQTVIIMLMFVFCSWREQQLRKSVCLQRCRPNECGPFGVQLNFFDIECIFISQLQQIPQKPHLENQIKVLFIVTKLYLYTM